MASLRMYPFHAPRYGYSDLLDEVRGLHPWRSRNPFVEDFLPYRSPETVLIHMVIPDTKQDEAATNKELQQQPQQQQPQQQESQTEESKTSEETHEENEGKEGKEMSKQDRFDGWVKRLEKAFQRVNKKKADKTKKSADRRDSTTKKHTEEAVRQESSKPQQLQQQQQPLLPTVPLAVDIVEHDNDFMIFADLPGVDESDLDIQVDAASRMLHIAAQRKPSADRLRRSFCGTYHRTLVMPHTVLMDSATASFENGVLTVQLAKRAVEGPKKLTIHSAAKTTQPAAEAPTSQETIQQAPTTQEETSATSNATGNGSGEAPNAESSNVPMSHDTEDDVMVINGNEADTSS